MRNPCGKKFSREHWIRFRRRRRDRRAAEKSRLKPACATEERALWSPKESPSPPGNYNEKKLGVGKKDNNIDSFA